MANALAILVGLKEVDPLCYGGWNGRNGCWGCELDVDNIQRILTPLGYQVHALKTSAATAETVLAALRGAARVLSGDDVLVFYFSGHGGQQPDQNDDERDGQDETLVAYNREIIDDELNQIWPSFQAGVRIVMLSDSCNSGTNYRLIGNFEETTAIQPVDQRVSRTITAQMIHFGGCRDGRTSSGYQVGGAFTTALCNAWDDGNFQGTYADFHQRICTMITSGQKPQYNHYGPVSETFRNQKPFAVNGRSNSGVRCTLEIPTGDVEQTREILRNDAAACLLEAFEKSVVQRPGSASGSCTTDFSGHTSCTGTVTWNF